jgi:site-specific DNA-methyltransferase (adenine-specific)
MNTDVMFSSKTVEWYTPQWLFDKLNDEFSFTLDPCSTHENAKCKKHYTIEENGLLQDWFGETVFVNPPYCKQTKEWVKKSYEESLKGATVVMLLPCRPDVSYFHDYILGKAEIRFWRGRIKFGGSKNSAPFPSMIVIFRGGTQ